jgi:hypothetical protein
MSDYKGDNIFEKIGALIPGYEGYSQREGRRDADKALREFIAKKMMHEIYILDDISNELLRSGRLAEIKRVDETKRSITIIADQVRYADYGVSGFFDQVQVDEVTLDRLYRQDLEIQARVMEIKTVFAQEVSLEGIATALNALKVKIHELQKMLDRRKDIIKEVI